MKEKLCKYCNKEIDFKKDKWSCINTYDGKKILEEANFHHNCFLEWWNGKLQNGAMNLYNKTMKETLGKVVPMIKEQFSS